MAFITILYSCVIEAESDAVFNAGRRRIVGEDGSAVVLDDTVRLVYSTITNKRPAIWQGLGGRWTRVELNGPRSTTTVSAVSGTRYAALRLGDIVWCSREETGAAMTLGTILDTCERIAVGGAVSNAVRWRVVREVGDDVIVENAGSVVLSAWACLGPAVWQWCWRKGRSGRDGWRGRCPAASSKSTF